MSTSFVVFGDAYLDRHGDRSLPLPAGPFETREAAWRWYEQQGVDNGEVCVGPLFAPELAGVEAS